MQTTKRRAQNIRRPRSLPGGSLDWIFEPVYGVYSQVDRSYGTEAFERGDGFPNAQGEVLVNKDIDTLLTHVAKLLSSSIFERHRSAHRPVLCLLAAHRWQLVCPRICVYGVRDDTEQDSAFLLARVLLWMVHDGSQ